MVLVTQVVAVTISYAPLSVQTPPPPPLPLVSPASPLSDWLVANWELGNSVRASRLSPEGSPSLRGPRPPL